LFHFTIYFLFVCLSPIRSQQSHRNSVGLTLFFFFLYLFICLFWYTSWHTPLDDPRASQTTQHFLSSETQRCAELSKDLDKQNRKVHELETHLEAGRNAMSTLQSTILGKSEQRFAIMAVDLENTVTEFNDKQARIANQAVELGRRTIEVAEREQDVTAREAAACALEAAQTKTAEDLDARERQVRGSGYGTMKGPDG
jgi:uncharacterized protein YukE